MYWSSNTQVAHANRNSLSSWTFSQTARHFHGQEYLRNAYTHGELQVLPTPLLSTYISG